jgi:membrane protease YdiL (CAAX protease family)
MSSSETSVSAPTAHWRIAPSVPVAIGVFIAYVVVFIGLSSTSGIAYDDWFDSGANAFRTAVIPLVGGCLVLIVFMVWARWDWVFKDPERLPMYGFLWVPVALFAVGIVVHLAVADWGKTSADLLLAILAAGVMVGFAEETLFRGIILRSLRTNLRPEAWVMLISSLWFGFFHLTNILNGSPAAGVVTQCLQASAAGVVLYVFRRVRGLLVVGMVAHGLWDMSVFVPAPTGTLAVADLAVQVLVVLSALVAAIIMLRRDRTMTVTSTGVQTR